MAKFNSAYQDLSIEGCYVTVGQPSPELAVQYRLFWAIFGSGQYRQGAWIQKILCSGHAPMGLGPRNMPF